MSNIITEKLYASSWFCRNVSVSLHQIGWQLNCSSAAILFGVNLHLFSTVKVCFSLDPRPNTKFNIYIFFKILISTVTGH